MYCEVTCSADVVDLTSLAHLCKLLDCLTCYQTPVKFTAASQAMSHGEDESSLSVDLPKSFARDAPVCFLGVVVLRYLWCASDAIAWSVRCNGTVDRPSGLIRGRNHG